MTDPRNALSLFLSQQARADLRARRAAVADMVKRGFGSALSPSGHMFAAPAPVTQRPATHLFEIDMLGVRASGETTDQAVANWFTVAARIDRQVSA